MITVEQRVTVLAAELQRLVKYHSSQALVRTGELLSYGQQFVERLGIDHRARQDMRADFRALLEHHHFEICIDLLQTDRGGEAGGERSAADHRLPHDSRARGSQSTTAGT